MTFASSHSSRTILPGGRPYFGGLMLNLAIWVAANDHHFALIAVRNLIRAFELPPPPSAGDSADRR